MHCSWNILIKHSQQKTLSWKRSLFLRIKVSKRYCHSWPFVLTTGLFPIFMVTLCHNRCLCMCEEEGCDTDLNSQLGVYRERPSSRSETSHWIKVNTLSYLSTQMGTRRKVLESTYLRLSYTQTVSLGNSNTFMWKSLDVTSEGLVKTCATCPLAVTKKPSASLSPAIKCLPWLTHRVVRKFW